MIGEESLSCTDLALQKKESSRLDERRPPSAEVAGLYKTRRPETDETSWFCSEIMGPHSKKKVLFFSRDRYCVLDCLFSIICTGCCLQLLFVQDRHPFLSAVHPIKLLLCKVLCMLDEFLCSGALRACKSAAT